MIKTAPNREVETCYVQGHLCIGKLHEWEGVVVGVVNDSYFIVEFFSAIDGSPTHREVVPVKRMADDGWRFFASERERDEWALRNGRRCIQMQAESRKGSGKDRLIDFDMHTPFPEIDGKGNPVTSEANVRDLIRRLATDDITDTELYAAASRVRMRMSREDATKALELVKRARA